MRRLLFILTFLLLAVNGLLVWQNWKAENKASKTCTRLVCKMELKGSDSGSFMLPGAWVYII